MSKKAAPPPPAPSPSWATFAIIGLFGLLFGATLMYFALRTRQPAPGTAPAATNPDPTSHQPDPALTAGP